MIIGRTNCRNLRTQNLKKSSNVGKVGYGVVEEVGLERIALGRAGFFEKKVEIFYIVYVLFQIQGVVKGI